jgi:two-component system chemotaxis response regulator CheB
MPSRLFVIGTSWNGVQSLCQLVARLPADFPAPICVVQHLSPEGPSNLPRILSKAGPLPASHPYQGESIRPGCIYVAPPDHHMLVRKGHMFLSRGPHENRTRPAVDALFRSAAIAYGPAVVGVVLTGHLDDGTAGLVAIKGGGGSAVVQDPAEASAPSMPTSALRHVEEVDFCCKVEEMPPIFVRLAHDDPAPARAEQSAMLIEIENRIAAGIAGLSDLEALEEKGRFCGLSCPECRSALCELPAQRILRFRCRAGHAFSAQSLLCAQADVRESVLSQFYDCLRDESTLADRVMSDPTYRGADFAKQEAQRAGSLHRMAEQLAEWSREMPRVASADALVQELVHDSKLAG